MYIHRFERIYLLYSNDTGKKTKLVFTEILYETYTFLFKNGIVINPFISILVQDKCFTKCIASYRKKKQKTNRNFVYC